MLQELLSGHTMELRDECNTCAKFQFYTEKVVSDSIFCDFTLLCESEK